MLHSCDCPINAGCTGTPWIILVWKTQPWAKTCGAAWKIILPLDGRAKYDNSEEFLEMAMTLESAFKGKKFTFLKLQATTVKLGPEVITNWNK